MCPIWDAFFIYTNNPTPLTCANMTLIKSYIFSIIKVNVYYGGLNHED